MEDKNVINVCEQCDSSQVRKPQSGEWKCYRCNHSSVSVNKRESKVSSTRNTKSMPTNVIPSYYEIIERIRQIGNKVDENNKNLSVDITRDKALVSFVYLTGMRLSEITGLRKEVAPSEYKYLNLPLTKEQVYFEEIEGEEIMIIRNAPTLKRRSRDGQGRKRREDHRRSIPIPVSQNNEMVGYIKDQLNNIAPLSAIFPVTFRVKQPKTLSKSNNPRVSFDSNIAPPVDDNVKEEKVEPWMNTMSYKWAYEIIKKQTGYYPHLYRHFRASHLVEMYSFSDADLRQFFGWASGEMPTRYTHLNMKSIISKMKGK